MLCRTPEDFKGKVAKINETTYCPGFYKIIITQCIALEGQFLPAKEYRQIMEVDDLTDHLTTDENRAYLLDLVPQP